MSRVPRRAAGLLVAGRRSPASRAGGGAGQGVEEVPYNAEDDEARGALYSGHAALHLQVVVDDVW
ncbi:hypothetical protein GTG23_31195 [Rhodococcus hoagii]|nr:hypothetical protein [Prescottella equi]